MIKALEKNIFFFYWIEIGGIRQVFQYEWIGVFVHTRSLKFLMHKSTRVFLFAQCLLQKYQSPLLDVDRTNKYNQEEDLNVESCAVCHLYSNKPTCKWTDVCGSIFQFLFQRLSLGCGSGCPCANNSLANSSSKISGSFSLFLEKKRLVPNSYIFQNNRSM